MPKAGFFDSIHSMEEYILGSESGAVFLLLLNINTLTF